MAGGRKLQNEQLEELAQRIARLLERHAPRKIDRLPLCEECGHRHRPGYCDEMCAQCIAEEN